MVLVDRSLGNEDDLVAARRRRRARQVARAFPASRPLARAARARGIPVWSEVELGYRLLPGARFVGVTGTNGKTTTTELLGAIFRAAGRDVAVAGNIGTPLTSVRAADWVVCELSSFQLEDVHDARLRRRRAAQPRARPPRPARHRSRPTATRSSASSSAPASKIVPRGLGLDGIEFSADDPLPAEPLLRGAHNRENAAAATAAARAAGIDDDAIAEALAHVPRRPAPARARRRGRRRALRQRLEGDERRRRAARRSRRTRDEPVHLILGGSLEGRGLRAARGRDRAERPARST